MLEDDWLHLLDNSKTLSLNHTVSLVDHTEAADYNFFRQVTVSLELDLDLWYDNLNLQTNRFG